MQEHDPVYYYPHSIFPSAKSSHQVMAGNVHTGRSERCTETDSLNCSLQACKRSDEVPCYSSEAGPSGKRSSSVLDTLKTAKTGTTASTSPQSDFSCPQPPSSSSSFRTPPSKQAPLNLASIAFKGLFRRLDTKVDYVHKPAMRSAPNVSAKNGTNSM
jgi:protein-serine/threonine kinase